MPDSANRLNTQERKVLKKLDGQEIAEILRKTGYYTAFKRKCDLAKTDPRRYEFDDLQTNYKKHYPGHFNIPMRMSRRPILEPRDPNPPDMYFKTQTQADFPPKPIGKIVRPTKKEDEYRPSSSKDAYVAITQYAADYPPKEGGKAISMQPVRQEYDRKAKMRFDDRTSHKEHYKSWAGQQSDNFHFQEIPAIAGDIIFNNRKGDIGQSITRIDYPGKYAKKPDAVKVAEPSIRIAMEGDFDHETVNQKTYKGSSPRRMRTSYKPQTDRQHMERGKFYGETQHMYDYPKVDKMNVRYPVLPAPDNICIDKNAQQHFNTVMNTHYKGYDVNEYPRPDAIRYDEQSYRPPSQKMDSTTITKQTYVPNDVKAAYNPPKRMPNQRANQKDLPRFNGQTTNNEHFVAWDVQTRPRFTDLAEGVKQQPIQGDFYGVTTMMDQFKPKSLNEPTQPFVPGAGSISTRGEQDFRTVHNTTYVNPQPRFTIDEVKTLNRAISKLGKSSGCQDFCSYVFPTQA